MKLYQACAVVAFLPLMACGTMDQGATDHHSMPEQRQAAEAFHCDNGLKVSVRPVDTEQIELTLDNKRALLQQTRAASGALYTANAGLFGSGAQWHQKAHTAFFSFKDPYGNVVETTCHHQM